MKVEVEGKQLYLDTEEKREEFIIGVKNGIYRGKGNLGENIEINLIQGVGFELKKELTTGVEYESYNSKGEKIT